MTALIRPHCSSGQTEEGRETFIYDQVGDGDANMGVGIRKGKWKLLLPGRKPEQDHRFLMDFGTNGLELYDLDRDIGEKNNVADDHPEVVKELRENLDSFKKGVKE